MPASDTRSDRTHDRSSTARRPSSGDPPSSVRPRRGTRAHLGRLIAAKHRRRMERHERKAPNLWAHLGLFGIVGWSVAIPTVLGAMSGWWLDEHWPQRFSWTVLLILFGLVFGCVVAWHWIERERRRAHDEHEATRREDEEADVEDDRGGPAV